MSTFASLAALVLTSVSGASLRAGTHEIQVEGESHLNLLQKKFTKSRALDWEDTDTSTQSEELADVPQRMQYWKRWEKFFASQESHATAVPDDKYLLFDADMGGLNNIRLGWETAGLIAYATRRILVLPPAQPFYLIDWGPAYLKPPQKDSLSRVEDFISLSSLRKGLRVYTFEEFLEKEKGMLNLPHDFPTEGKALPNKWKEFAAKTYPTVHGGRESECNLQSYDRQDRVLYARQIDATDGRLFGCTKWWELGEVELKNGSQEYQAPPAARALLHGGFVWHNEVFQLAAPIVRDLGMFNYSALHARFGDFQFTSDKQSTSDTAEKWFDSDLGKKLTLMGDPKKAVYMSTDASSERRINAFKEKGINIKWSKDYFENPQSPIASLLQSKSAARIHQLKGPVEQVVCAFSQIFVGTGHSTFSGYINRMRLSLDAPQTKVIHQTDPLTKNLVDEVEQAVQAWHQRDGAEKLSPATTDSMALWQVQKRVAFLQNTAYHRHLSAGKGFTQ